MGNAAQHCRLGLFQDSDIAGDLRTLNQLRGESSVSSEVEEQANRKGLNRKNQKMTLKPRKTSGRFKVTSSIVITMNLEFNSMFRKKKHSPFHWNTLMWPELLNQIWMWCKKNVLTIIGMWPRIEVYQILGKDSQSSLFLKEKPPEGFTWSGWRLTKNQATTRLENLWPEVWTNIRKAAQRKEKQEGANEKPKLDNARRSSGIHFNDPEDGEFLNDHKNTRRKL